MKARTAITFILTLLLPFTLMACGTKEPEEPPDLRGKWRQVLPEDGTEPQYYHIAEITDDGIEIRYVYTPDGSVNLYWTGTFVLGGG